MIIFTFHRDQNDQISKGALAEVVVSDPESTDYKILFGIENPNQSDLEWLDEVKDKL